jgi:serine protease AprX
MISSVAERLAQPHARIRLIIAAALAAAMFTPLFAAGLAHRAQPGPSAAGTSLPVHTAGSWVGPAHISGELAGLAATHPGARVEVIIQLTRGVPAAQGRTLVRSLGGRPEGDLPIINGLWGRMSAGAARRLGESPLVRAVSLNAPLKESTLYNISPSRLATTFDQSVGATQLWSNSTGEGVGVAVIDTGVAGDLPDFRANRWDPTSRVVASAVIDPGATTAGDGYGHGTLVAGLVGGNGYDRSWNDPLRGQYVGAAPRANLISIKISDETGAASTLDAIYGLQFAVDHKNDYNIRVINMSFRSTQAESYQTDPIDAAAEQAWNDGIVVVAAAGNLGTASDAVSYAPGNDPYVLTVGAVDEQGSSNTANEVQASWSSQGTTQDGFSKPDVLAPGAHIVSTLAPGSAFASLCPSCVTGGAYFQASGTSLAAPIVAGIAADLVADHPDWTPSMVKGAIVNTAVPLSGGGSEVSAPAADAATGDQLVSDQNLTPNSLIDPNTGEIDYSAASWSAGSWSTATQPLAASWSAASWSCDSCSGGAGSVNPQSASWSTVGWATMWN